MFDSKGGLAKATFKPQLSAYYTTHYKGGQLTVDVNGIIETFQSIDLTKLGDQTNYVITEDLTTGIYSIALDK